VTRPFDGMHALVIGFGVSGRAAAEALLEGGASVRVSEERERDRIDVPFPGELDVVEILAGGHREEHLDGIDVVVVSPGVPEGAPVLRWGVDRGVPIWSELELGARLCTVPLIAVTGTNGKTTTAELLASMLRASGVRTTACGNVGFPFTTAARGDFDALVVEASSFQLRFHTSLHPKVSVLVNLAPDHLDWHASFAAYAEAKARIYVNQRESDVHVGNADDPAAATVSRRAPCPVAWFGRGGEGPLDARLVARTVTATLSETTVDFALPPDTTEGFAEDAAAAVLAALRFGVGPEAVAEGLRTPPRLEHRGCVVAEFDGVVFVDDSKATNPHAALAALAGRRDVVLIAGGLAKGVDLSPLGAASPALRAVVAIGEAAPDLLRIFSGRVPAEDAGSMEEAVALAFDAAVPGGTVLLAPACASQDMFRDYRERGERFAAAASALAQRARRG
jgi:UDP-N-acetylmuramoylalanine--D-glutamate ligase